jgi:hypothetical protein
MSALAIRRFGDSATVAGLPSLPCWLFGLQCPKVVNYVRLLGCYYAPAVHNKAGYTQLSHALQSPACKRG